MAVQSICKWLALSLFAATAFAARISYAGGELEGAVRCRPEWYRAEPSGRPPFEPLSPTHRRPLYRPLERGRFTAADNRMRVWRCALPGRGRTEAGWTGRSAGEKQ